jgi:hypothetical protein
LRGSHNTVERRVKIIHKYKIAIISVIITKCETDCQRGATTGYNAAAKRADKLFRISVGSVGVKKHCIFVQLKFKYVLGTFKSGSKEAENSFLGPFHFLLFPKIEIKLRSQIFEDMV